MDIENLQLGDKIDYADYPELFGDELTFEQLCTEPSNSLLIVWRSAFAGSNAEDAKQAEICRVERVADYEDGDLYIATVMLDAGGKSPFPVEWDDMEETEPDDEADKMQIWNLYDRIWRLKQEEPEMIVTENRTPPADANLAVTEQYTTAYNLNVKIHTSMQAIQQNLYDMCSALKQMRDGKLYKELGYQNFEEYCENEAGITRSQAYKYITIIEKLPPDFVLPVTQIGMRKLYLLTALTDDQRDQLTETVDLESTTVRELKAQIAALQSQNADTEKARIDAEERAQKWYDEAQDAQEAKERNRLTLVGLMEKKQEQVRQLEAKIKELENQPQDVAVIDRTEEIDRLNAEIADLREKLAEKPDMQMPMNVEPIYQQDTKAVYNAYLRSVTTTLENLCRFIRTNRSDKNHDYFEENFRLTLENAVKSIEEE
jgi:hypothetical protein